MRWNRWRHSVASQFLACVFLGLIALASWAPGSLAGILAPEQPLQPQQEDRPRASQHADIPQKAHDLLKILRDRNGVPLPGYVGGRDFNNRERRLPPGRYREYDVNPKVRGQSRDAERIVIEQRTGNAYYTGDHYRTFIPLNQHTESP
ncbi:MAG: ribonuclease domain-containing protein [Nitrospira sp.]|jgi:ribonuclease T1|nr:ribonuclease domain-containing protein [Nitrospira sp.]